MLSLKQLLTPVSEDDVLAGMLGILDSLGFAATAWEAGDAPRTIVQMFARLVSDVTVSIADITSGGFAGLAKGPYADLLGNYFFKLPRVLATPTAGYMLLTSDIAGIPHTINPNEIFIASSPADDAQEFVCLSGPVTLNPGDTLVISVAAVVAGAAGNIPTNLASLQLRTDLLGVTVTNPPQPPLTTGTTWISVPGTDDETDGPGGRYNARMLARWERLTYGNTGGTYEAWALEAVPAITRIRVRESGAPGAPTVRITCATAVGGIDGTQKQRIADYLNGLIDGKFRRPMNDVLEIVSANPVTTPALGLGIVVRSTSAADAVARVASALVALQGSLPIGGKIVSGSSYGRVLLSDLYRTVMAQDGLIDVEFSFDTDIPLGQDDIYTATPMISMVIQA